MTRKTRRTTRKPHRLVSMGTVPRAVLRRLTLSELADLILSRGLGDLDPSLDVRAQVRFLKQRARWARSDLCRRTWLQQKREKSISIDPVSHRDHFHEIDDGDQIDFLCGVLPPQDIEVLTLWHIHERSADEIGRRLQRPVQSVYALRNGAERRAETILNLERRRSERS